MTVKFLIASKNCVTTAAQRADGVGKQPNQWSNYLPVVFRTHVRTCPCIFISPCSDLKPLVSNRCELCLSPGLGRSKSAEAPAAVGELAPAGFLKEVCEQLSLTPAVVISPSLSGMYSLPFLHQHQALIRAYIPVAPICTDKFTAEQYHSVKVQSYMPSTLYSFVVPCPEKLFLLQYVCFSFPL